MADLTITTDFSQVNNLKESLQTLPPAYARVVDSVLRENNRLNRLLKKAAKDGADINKLKEQSDARYAAQLQKEADKRERIRAREAKNAEKEAKRIEAANQKQIASEVKLRAELEKKAAKSAQNFQAQVGPNLGLGAQGISASASGSAFEKEIERLRQKYDGIYASSQLYESSLNEINQAHTLGAISVKQHEAAVESLNTEYQNFQNGVAQAGNRFAQHINQSSTGMNKYGLIAQQTGYQVSDFIVQVQSGTNPLVAFSQQATQLSGLLYELPPRFMAARFAVMGFSVGMSAIVAGITIGIPLLAMLAMNFFSSGKKAEEGAKGVDKYKEALNGLVSAIGSTQTEINKLTFGTEDAAVAGARKAMQDAQTEVARLTSSQTKIRGQFAPTDEEKAAIDEAVKNYRDLVVTLNDLTARQKALAEAQKMLNGGSSVAASIQKGLVYDTEVQLRLARELKEVNQQVKEGLVDPQKNLAIQREYQALLQAGVKPVEAMAEAQYKVERSLIQASLASGQLTNEQNVAAQAALRILDATFAIDDKIRQSAAETELLEKGMSQSAIDALKLAGVDITSGIASASAEALLLMTRLGLSLDTATRLAALGPQGIGGNDPSGGTYSGRGGLSQTDIVGIRVAGTFGYTTPPSDDKKKGGGGADKKDPLEELRQQIELENELLGVSEAQARVIQALGMDRSKYSQAEINAITAEIEAYNQKQEAIERTKNIMDTVKSSMEDAFMSVVDGTMSAKDAFRSMAADIIKELYRVLVVQRIVGAISGAFGGGGGSFFSAPSTGSFGLPFGGALATGGPVDPNKVYLVGEKGPELVIPRQSGTVVNAAQTAQAMGSASGDVTVNNNITVTGSDAAMVRVEIAKMIPQITNATKAAVIDAKQRGGQMAAAFR